MNKMMQQQSHQHLSKNYNDASSFDVLDHTNEYHHHRDLQESYHNAIQCLKQCESIIGTLQDELSSKDEIIATLEMKIVQMSLELTKLQAFEDVHRSTRRVSTVETVVDSVDDTTFGSGRIADGSTNASTSSNRSSATIECNISSDHTEVPQADDDDDTKNNKKVHLLQKGRRRATTPGDSSTSNNFFPTPIRNRRRMSTAATAESQRTPINNKSRQRRASTNAISWSGRLFASSFMSGLLDLDESSNSATESTTLRGSTSTMDESSHTSRSLSNMGQFGSLFKNKSSSFHHHEKEQDVEEDGGDVVSDRRKGAFFHQPQDHHKQTDQQQQQQLRRERSKHRMLNNNNSNNTMLLSSLTSIPGVVFPTSFEEVINKGLVVRPGSSGAD